MTPLIKIKIEPNPVIDKFLSHCHRRNYPKKSIIIHGGDTPNSLYYITKGSVSVIAEDDSGHEIVLAYLNSGAFFGEMGLFSHGPERSAWIRAREECEVAEISYDRFRQVATAEPELIFKLASHSRASFPSLHRSRPE